MSKPKILKELEILDTINKRDILLDNTNQQTLVNATLSNSAKVEIEGNMTVNLLGRDGDCEDVSKWDIWQITPTLDTSNKIFGSNAIKLTLGGTEGTFANSIAKYGIDITKHYLFTAYVKNNNANGIKLVKDAIGGGWVISSTTITDTTKSTRVGIVVPPCKYKYSK